jgi:hypothetical protein
LKNNKNILTYRDMSGMIAARRGKVPWKKQGYRDWPAC